ncbi:MAG: hypothetical protein H6R18_128 [Proteobacteria bacterium]|nr:hypothetical protein [Pseudomonadota bacterium]
MSSAEAVARTQTRPLQIALTLTWLALLAFFFAQVEIQIEGSAGWGANLPTWRVEEHWLLDIFWGGRAMTGYHAWVFPFVALFFHLPLFFMGTWTPRLQCRVIGCIMLFWIVEDFLWFILNPAYGLQRFSPQHIPWHKNWIGMAPTDYWMFLVIGSLLLWFSWREKK